MTTMESPTEDIDELLKLTGGLDISRPDVRRDVMALLQQKYGTMPDTPPAEANPISDPPVPTPTLASMLAEVGTEVEDEKREAYGAIVARAPDLQADDLRQLLKLAGTLGIGPRHVEQDLAYATRERKIVECEKRAEARVAELATQAETLRTQSGVAQNLLATGTDVTDMARIAAGMLTIAFRVIRHKQHPYAMAGYLRASGWRQVPSLNGTPNWSRPAPGGTNQRDWNATADLALRHQVVEDLRSPNGRAMLNALAEWYSIGGMPRMTAIDPDTIRPEDLRPAQ